MKTLTTLDAVPRATIDYDEPLAYNYLWRVTNLSTFRPEYSIVDNSIKDGFARAVYIINGRPVHGGLSRIKGTLRDIERAFVLERGSLIAVILRMKLDNWEAVLAAEQFVHGRNKDQKIINLVNSPLDKVGGKSEFYRASEKTMIGRFTNSWRKSNLRRGGFLRDWKREKEIHGVPVFMPQTTLEGGVA